LDQSAFTLHNPVERFDDHPCATVAGQFPPPVDAFFSAVQIGDVDDLVGCSKKEFVVSSGIDLSLSRAGRFGSILIYEKVVSGRFLLGDGRGE
jgi:hypothetical protein